MGRKRDLEERDIVPKEEEGSVDYHSTFASLRIQVPELRGTTAQLLPAEGIRLKYIRAAMLLIDQMQLFPLEQREYGFQLLRQVFIHDSAGWWLNTHGNNLHDLLLKEQVKGN